MCAALPAGPDGAGSWKSGRSPCPPGTHLRGKKQQQSVSKAFNCYHSDGAINECLILGRRRIRYCPGGQTADCGVCVNVTKVAALKKGERQKKVVIFFIKMFTRTWLKRPRDSCLSLWFTDADVEPRVDPAAVLLRPGCTQLPCASSNLVTRSELLTTLVPHPAVRTDRLSKATGQSRTPIKDHHHYHLNHHQLLEMWPNVCSGEPGQSLS